MKKIVKWLVYSSTDPSRYSATIKAAGLGLVTTITMVAGFANIQVGDLTPLVDAVVSLVQGVLALVSTVWFIYGFVRKLWLSFLGKNKVTNESLEE